MLKKLKKPKVKFNPKTLQIIKKENFKKIEKIVNQYLTQMF